MKRQTDIGRLGSIDMAKVEEITKRRVFDDLRRSIVASERMHETGDEARRLRTHPRYRHPAVPSSVAAAVLLVVGLAVFVVGGSSGLTHPETTPWQMSRAFSLHGPMTHKVGTWQLVDDLLTGTWQQNASGPPPGDLDCPSASTCYAMSGHYPNAMAGAPLLGESLYVSNDVGTTWVELPMPTGFAPTSGLSCASSTTCAAGGTYQGQAVLVVTSDGGHTFTINPLPGGLGSIYALSCSTTQFCGALVARSADDNNTPTDATFLSTSDGGEHFTDSTIENGDSMQSIDCSSALNCTTVGTDDAYGVNDWTAGVSAVTTDGGATWSGSALPAGFGISYLSRLSCANATDCAVTGTIDATVANPPQCNANPVPTMLNVTTPTEPTPTTQPSSQVQAIARSESAAATAENNRQAEQAAKSKSPVASSCSSNTQMLLGDIAMTSDGGETWTPEAMPTDVPQPQLSGLACPSANECWASGEDAVPEQVGSASNGGSPVLLGTTDGGQTWSKVTFRVPTGAANYDGQSYLSMGFISCPTTNVCVSLGAAAQGSPTTPVYSLVVPASG